MSCDGIQQQRPLITKKLRTLLLALDTGVVYSVAHAATVITLLLRLDTGVADLVSDVVQVVLVKLILM